MILRHHPRPSRSSFLLPTLLLASLAAFAGGCGDDDDKPGAAGGAGTAGSGGTAGNAGASGSSGSSGMAGSGGGGNTFTGTLVCDATPLEFPFSATASEVYRFDVAWAVGPMAEAGASVSCTLFDGSGPIQEGGNDLGFGAAVYPGDQKPDKRVYNFREDGGFKWVCSSAAPGCNPATFTLSNGKLRSASTNRTKASARAIQIDAPKTTNGTIGCEEMRYFTFEAEAGHAYTLSLGGNRVPDVVSGGSAQIALLDSSDQPLQEGGNDIVVPFDFDDVNDKPAATHVVTFESAGTYQLVLSYWNGCSIGDYQIAVTTASP